MLFETQLEQFKQVSPVVRNSAIAAVAAAGVVGILLLGPLHGVYGKVQPKGSIEYGSPNVNVAAFLKSPDDSVTVAVQGSLDTTKVGEHVLPITLSKWFISNPTEAHIMVKDSQAPVVTFKKDKVSVEIGDEVTPSKNIESVSDPVDGELAPVTEEPEARGTEVGTEVFYDAGWYMAESPFVAKEAGVREVSVVAADRHGNQTVATYTLEVVDPLKGVKVNKIDKILEYGKESIDALSVVKCSDPDTKLTAKDIDTSKIGKQKITYTLEKHKSTRSVERTFFVYDTQAPVIEIVAPAVQAGQYENYDMNSNILRVEDPVDGALSLVTEAPKAKGSVMGHEEFYDQGWYRIVGNVDVNTLGSYPITVEAFDKHGNNATISYTVTVVDPLQGVTLTARNANVEYGQGNIDSTALVTCSDPTVELSATTLDTSTLGTKEVTFTLRKGQSMRKVTMDFTVRDTQTPVITLGSGTVNVKLGKSYNGYDNIVSVTDPVDGRLSRVSTVPSNPGNGWYTLSGSYNTGRAGRYSMTVVACDKNGNRSTRDFDIVVK